MQTNTQYPILSHLQYRRTSRIHIRPSHPSLIHILSLIVLLNSESVSKEIVESNEHMISSRKTSPTPSRNVLDNDDILDHSNYNG